MKKRGSYSRIGLVYEDNQTQERSLRVSICKIGIKSKVFAKKVLIRIADNHPLILLANLLPWEEMYDLILPDLKKTAKGNWRVGRKLKVRIHLGVYVLQQVMNLTDRKMEYAVKDNAAYQLFCGKELVKKWHCPDHTKIEEFRSRLTPETQRKLANLMVTNGVKLGIADASALDIDSTVQEANMTYPTDGKMLKKLGMICSKVSAALKKRFLCDKAALEVNVKEISSKANHYFFLPKKTSSEDKAKALKDLWESVSEPVKQIVNVCIALSEEEVQSLLWNIKKAMTQLIELGESYLSAAKKFIDTQRSKKGKRLSFHLSEVFCCTKGKVHKKYEFGRAFQLGRIIGNFLFVIPCTDVVMEDSKSFAGILSEHEKLFGKEILNSVSTDTNYYSEENVKLSKEKKIRKIGIQRARHITDRGDLTVEDRKMLYNRRAGIEPLIGHAKQGGQLGRSRMKSDQTILASGYSSILGFNLRQTIRAIMLNKAQDLVV